MEPKRTPASFVPWAAAFLLIALVLPASLRAQETRGRITGRVTDTTEAMVPGATVTVTNVARGATVSTTTNERGVFQVNYLLPGTYTVTVELSGFKKYIRDNLLLQISETRHLAVVLEVGGVQETVSVTAEAPTVNTSDANLGLVVDQARLASLPLIHGDPYKIMGLAPGLTATGSARLDRPYEPTHIIGYAYQGTRGNRSDLLIDGAPSTATAGANEVIATYVPPSDMIQEFKVQTATFDAQFGNTEGGVTSISIKSGTNRFHGSGYYFAEPYKLGANDFFGKARGQAIIKSSSDRPGFSIGGPIFKDKTFFMFGFEHITDVRPRFDAAGTSWVPTDALRNGDFSAYSSLIKIYDPLTRVLSGTQWVGQQFPGNIIPPDRISPLSKKILEYYSPPKHDGLVGNITDSELSETAKYNTLTGRVDQQFSNSNRMFGRFSYYKRDSLYNDYLDSIASGTNVQFISYQAVVDDVHIFNPTTVLNVRYGYNRFERNSGQKMEARNLDFTTLGFPAEYNTLIPEVNRYFPRLDFDGDNMLDIAQGADYRPVITQSVSAVLNKTLSSHSLKGGMEFRQYGEDSRSTANAQGGRYQFTNTYTRPSTASSSDVSGLQNYAAFLLGMPSTTSISRNAAYSEYSRTWGFFVQDDWRVNDKLTLNLGLRYEVENALVERNNQSITGFDYDYVQPIQATVQANYATLNDPALKALVPQLYVKGGLKYAGVDGEKRGLYKTPKDTFLPRVGFAYQVIPQTVIRGGAGLFAGFLGERRGDVITYGYSQDTTIGTTFNAYGAVIPRSWDNALLTEPILEPVGNANRRQTNLGQGITFFNPNPDVSKQLRYQISVQRALPGGFTVEAAYVGNYGYNIEITRNINALPREYLNTDNARTAAMIANNAFLQTEVNNPFAGLLPGTSYNNPKIQRRQLMRPYPAFGDMNTTNNDGKTWYHSGQLGLQKRFSKGYTLGISYTRSRWTQATEYLNATDPKPTKMISDQDVTNRLVISGIFELPFGKGRRFLSGASGIVDGLVGGWQVQGSYGYQTGFPIGFGDLFYNGGSANGTDIALPADQRTTAKWFNTDVFTSILNSTGSNMSPVDHLRTLPTRFNAVRRDSGNSVDLSLLKDIRLPKGMQIQLRAEFINAFNEPLFPAPQTGPTLTTFGQVTASNQDNYARRAQLGIKVLF